MIPEYIDDIYGVKALEVYEMAGFDGTGPMGKGPMTGGRRGHCNPAGVEATRAFGYGRSWPGVCYGGRVVRRARGRISVQNSAIEPADELETLKRRADGMKNSLDNILSRIAELEKTPGPLSGNE
ncbi:MAG: DUF5320 domain-containing protein [Desulfobulbaceae bacterium]|jgi:hypothetical protein|nr:DUF5320 domain-containing protein [Desulfobulbaceae bacterium]